MYELPLAALLPRGAIRCRNRSISDETRLTKTVEDGLEKSLGFQVSTMLRSADEIEAMLALDPFKGIEVTKATRLYVTLLTESHARLISSLSKLEFFRPGHVGVSITCLSAYSEFEREKLEGLLDLLKSATSDRCA